MKEAMNTLEEMIYEVRRYIDFHPQERQQDRELMMHGLEMIMVQSTEKAGGEEKVAN